MKNKGTYTYSGIVDGKQIECEYDYECSYYPSTRETPEEYDENLNPTKLTIDGNEIECNLKELSLQEETFWDDFYDDSELFRTLAGHAQSIISEADSRQDAKMETDFEHDEKLEEMVYEMRALDESEKEYCEGIG